MCINHNVNVESLFKLVDQGNKKEKEKLKSLYSTFIILFIIVT